MNRPAAAPGNPRPIVVPPGVPSWITPQLIEQTLRTWQPYYSQPLTVEEAIAMIRNVGRLFDALSGD